MLIDINHTGPGNILHEHNDAWQLYAILKLRKVLYKISEAQNMETIAKLNQTNASQREDTYLCRHG